MIVIFNPGNFCKDGGSEGLVRMFLLSNFNTCKFVKFYILF
jgi:hypothetical protein